MLRRLCLFVAFSSLLLLPAVAEAHPGGIALHSWSAGFNHPFHGLDHLLAMVAVGIWGAQQRGRTGWLLPATFVGVMALGGAVGAAGFAIPGVEAMILLSVIVFCGLVLTCARFGLGASLCVVGLFAFFHGFAHGQEMPDTASLASFGFGFLVATALLHAMGYASARMAIAAMRANGSRAP